MLLIIPFVLAEEGVNQVYYSITNCTDSDGDNPSMLGDINWNYIATDGSTGGGSGGDRCYGDLYGLKYGGKKFRRGETVLVEGVCPSDFNTRYDQPGDILTSKYTSKYYKCKYQEIKSEARGTLVGFVDIGCVCTNTPKEISAKVFIDAYIKWEENGRPAPSFMTRLLRLLGWG